MNRSYLNPSFDVQIIGLARLLWSRRQWPRLRVINICSLGREYEKVCPAPGPAESSECASAFLAHSCHHSFLCVSMLCPKILILIFFLLNTVECLRLENYMFLCSWFNMLSGRNLSSEWLLLEKYGYLLSPQSPKHLPPGLLFVLMKYAICKMQPFTFR